jgi:hypothetical protein
MQARYAGVAGGLCASRDDWVIGRGADCSAPLIVPGVSEVLPGGGDPRKAAPDGAKRPLLRSRMG